MFIRTRNNGHIMEQINSERFKQEIDNAELTIMDIYTDWCTPCKRIAPMLEELSCEGYRVFKVNAEEERDLCLEYNILAVPTLLIFKGGNQVDKIGGMISKEQLIERLTNA